jgi:hypothetical protein
MHSIKCYRQLLPPPKVKSFWLSRNDKKNASTEKTLTDLHPSPVFLGSNGRIRRGKKA